MLEDRLHNLDNRIVFSCFLKDDWLNEFRMPHHVLLFVYEGIMHVEFGSGTMDVKPGQFVFLRRDHKVKIHKTSYEGKAWKSINILLKNDTLRKYVREHKEEICRIREKRRIEESAFIIPHISETESLYQNLVPYLDKTLSAPESFSEDIVNRTISALVGMDSRFCPTLFDFVDTWKINLADFMEQNFTNDMTLKEFALYTGRSLATFKRDFAKFSNMSPEQWLTTRRLDRAYELLKQGMGNISEICWSVGFHNRSHFTIAFKRQFGVVPSEVK